MVHFRGALTRSCKPGDAVSISGVFLPEPYHGFRAIKAGLLTSTYLDAMGVTQLKQSYQQHAMDQELQARMHVMLLCACLIPSTCMALVHSGGPLHKRQMRIKWMGRLSHMCRPWLARGTYTTGLQAALPRRSLATRT